MSIDRGIRRAFRSEELRRRFDRLIREGGEARMDGGGHVAVRMADGRVVRLSTTATGRRNVARLECQLKRPEIWSTKLSRTHALPSDTTVRRPAGKGAARKARG